MHSLPRKHHDRLPPVAASGPPGAYLIIENFEYKLAIFSFFFWLVGAHTSFQ
jgi:hypothetical protein